MKFVRYHIILTWTGSKLQRDGLCTYGNNPYTNSPFVATLFKALSSGAHGAYILHHSKLRINVECSFGILADQWVGLRSPTSIFVSLAKTTALVCAL